MTSPASATSPATAPHPYADFVARVEKPARYLGGEYQSVKKERAAVDVRLALAFPDVYDIGMSHLGTKILYSLLNKHPRIACERAFTPWVDMERELRTRGLPLVTLESAEPLSAFDVIGISLQYEMTFTNVLTLLDLGGVPLLAADRSDDAPLVLGGGPVATHPEPMAPFFDAFLIGEAEEVLPELLLAWAKSGKEGLSRRERLIRLAARGGVYVPSLYTTGIDPVTDMEVTTGVVDERVPRKVDRVWVKDLNQFPFPTDNPVPYAEAVFDRVSVEIARGCTEGCRFCQAGMIYRPVRERGPDEIVKAVVEGVKRGGYDETSLTALSTADVSCITPLVKKVMGELKQQQVSLSVSSLRAYGLNEELLDEMSSVRATGLTFAPEAGTQRMRDVINKNITEEDVAASADKIFARGWSRMKCYFMIGLPTETDEDVAGIAQTGGRLKRRGKRVRKDADVTVSVSSHVPKPHTPFQWCAMDSLDEIRRKQRLLRAVAQDERVSLKWHEATISHVEGVLARGDRRVSRAILEAWRSGARFDGWDDQFKFELWTQAFDACGIDRDAYLGTRPVDARLPWDHLDVGLAEGFLAWEYRRALKGRLSTPCGKPNRSLLHHTNLEEAEADTRKLVCYDCGIACDLTQMREERLVALRTLGALKRPAPRPAADEGRPSRVSLPVVGQRPTHAEAAASDRLAVPTASADALAAQAVAGDVPSALPDSSGASSESTATSSGRRGPSDGSDETHSALGDAEPAPYDRGQGPRPMGFDQVRGTRWRLVVSKTGRASFIAHLDTMRLLIRLFRRAEIELVYSKGFHPKPQLTFGPALGLAVASLGEPFDVRLNFEGTEAELVDRLRAVAPEGLLVEGARRLAVEDLPLPRHIGRSEWAAWLPGTPTLRGGDGLTVVRTLKGQKRQIDVSDRLLDWRALELDGAGSDEADRLRALLGWPQGGTLLRFATRIEGDGGVKPSEVIEALTGTPPGEAVRLARVALRSRHGTEVLELEALRDEAPPKPAAARETEPVGEGSSGDASVAAVPRLDRAAPSAGDVAELALALATGVASPSP